MDHNKSSHHSPSGSRRLSCLYCSISAAAFSLGVIILVAGIVIYILTITDASHHYPYWGDFFHPVHSAEQRLHAPIILAIVLGSVGIAFILFAIIFAILACLNTEREYDIEQYESTQKNGAKNTDEQEVLLTPIINSKDSKTVSSDTAPKRVGTDLADSSTQGDLNTVGLPSAMSGGRHRVPPNGFSYLQNPSEIQNYYENKPHNPLRNPNIIRESNYEASYVLIKKESAI